MECTIDKRCYWNSDYKIGRDECISSAEQFYKVLARLLIRRGKQDFAIRIEHHSAPGRAHLPFGPSGPGEEMKTITTKRPRPM